MPAATSPCTKVCQLDPATNICLGCRRTLAEIAAWPSLTEAQRLQIMATLEARKEAVLF
jgi:predicted Fe-S protein YdhL (DUF1289 family)